MKVIVAMLTGIMFLLAGIFLLLLGGEGIALIFAAVGVIVFILGCVEGIYGVKANSTGGTSYEQPTPQKQCPGCGEKHDFDYPRCPWCGYDHENPENNRK